MADQFPNIQLVLFIFFLLVCFPSRRPRDQVQVLDYSTGRPLENYADLEKDDGEHCSYPTCAQFMGEEEDNTDT